MSLTASSGPYFCIACNLEVATETCADGEHEGKLVAVVHDTSSNLRCTGVGEPVLSHPRIPGTKEPSYMLVP